MLRSNRMSKKEIKNSRLAFWIVWTFLMTFPVSLSTYFLDGAWWASPVAVIISTVVGYNTFEWWLRNQKAQADNLIVLCYCGHSEADHGSTYDMDRACYYGDLVQSTKSCLCLEYAPRFWQMARRT